MLNKDLGLPTCLAALAITAVLSIKSRSNPIRLAREISWGTLILVAGLFVMVDAVESVGALNLMKAWLAWAQNLAPAAGALVVGFTVGVTNNLVNNLPLGLIAGATLQATHAKGLIAHAVLIGVDLGHNLSVTGSLATILWLLALRKEKLERLPFEPTLSRKLNCLSPEETNSDCHQKNANQHEADDELKRQSAHIWGS
jgi:arsenical pump membrane protein